MENTSNVQCIHRLTKVHLTVRQTYYDATVIFFLLFSVYFETRRSKSNTWKRSCSSYFNDCSTQISRSWTIRMDSACGSIRKTLFHFLMLEYISVIHRLSWECFEIKSCRSRILLGRYIDWLKICCFSWSHYEVYVIDGRFQPW